jgi:hypothetical protein
MLIFIARVSLALLFAEAAAPAASFQGFNLEKWSQTVLGFETLHFVFYESKS